VKEDSPLEILGPIVSVVSPVIWSHLMMVQDANLDNDHNERTVTTNDARIGMTG
jgi:hypothetical protein